MGYGWHLLRSAQFISQSRNVTLLRYEADTRNEPRHAYCHCYKRIRPCKIKLRRGEQTRICVRSVPTSTHNQRERVPCHVDRNSVGSDMKYVLQLRLGQDVGTLANRKWVVTAFIKIKAKLKDNPWNKRQTTYVTTRDLHTQHLRGRRYWEAISGCSSTYFIPRISARVVCVCVCEGEGRGSGRGLEKRHHLRLYAPAQNYSIETVQQNKYLQKTGKVRNYIHEEGKKRTESTSA